MNAMNHTLIAVGMGALLASFGCGSQNTRTANQTAPERTGTASREMGANLSSADRDFMMNAAQGGMAEVQMGQLAKDKGRTEAVKNYGDRLVTDHTKANDQLKSIASKDGVTLPAQVDAKQKATIDRLSKLHGAAFDREFAKIQVKDHENDISEFQKEANQGQDTEVKSFASSTVPTLQEHLQIARDLQSGKHTTHHATE